MSIAVVTGASGLVGSEAVRFFHEKGLAVVGIDNNLREYFFGDAASTAWKTDELKKSLPTYEHHALDIRDRDAIFTLFRRLGKEIVLVIHAAAQPSHDWAAREPFTDFSVNAQGTLVMLEATRLYCPDAVLLFTSTNKVYGDSPNSLPLVEGPLRWELDPSHPYAVHGIDEGMTLDQSKHSLFGVSKAAADLLTQEYGRYFGLKTITFRGGCLTGPSHAGAELHGFLAYLVRCAVSGDEYTIHGYKGKQVRDNIHSFDLINAFWRAFQSPQAGKVYNMGGSRHSNCSILEAIECIERTCGKQLKFKTSEKPRSGDHIWWISDVRRFQQDYPEWRYSYSLEMIIAEIVEAVSERAKHASKE